MKSLNILQHLLQDASVSTGASTTRDWITIQSRFEHEGLSFLTITLPKFCQWLEKSIDEGIVGPTIYSLFRKTRRKNGSVLPCLFYGLTALVFDSKSGLLLKDADVNAVFFIRQICLLWKKVKIPCSPLRVGKALASHKATDLSLKHSDRNMFFEVEERICIDTTIRRMLCNYDLHGLLPKHGPGATVEKITGNSKFRNRDYMRRWQNVIGWEELYGLSTIDQFDHDSVVDPKDEKPVRIVIVPKTQKGPRVIAVEPIAMQYAQQLVSSRLRESIERSIYGGRLNFDTQVPNREMARYSSKNGDYATMDLSEASDRVSCKLVREVFRSRPDILEQLFAVRSTRCTYPDGTTANLRKYASMGSATTFPVEAIVFYALVVTACARFHFRHSGRLMGGKNGLLRSLRYVRDKVLVFGDDLIVPATFCNYVIDYLEIKGLKVNRDKTFDKGLFRESCGMDAFKGYDVTPVYIRHDPYDGSKSPEWFAATVSLSNQLFLRGMWSAAKQVEGLLPSLPLVAVTSPGLGFWHYSNAYTPHRYSVRNHEWQVRTKVVSGTRILDKIQDSDALIKFFLSKEMYEDPDHLSYSAKRYSSKLSTKWVTPY